MTPIPDKLLTFYAGTGWDDRGRTFDDVLRFTHVELEDVHDYIQWVFPLFQRSGANPAAPVLDDRTAEAFRRDQSLRRQMRRIFDVMLGFYGLEMVVANGAIRVNQNASFQERRAVWLTRNNHNFLRLTRILKCLSILHASDLSRALLACLLEIDAQYPAVISTHTIRYWRDAVPL